MGLVRGQFEQHRIAVALHERAAELEPANATMQGHLGAALVALGRFPQAQAAFEAALRVAPHDAVAHNGLGAALDRLGRSDEAEAEFRAALALDPTLGEAACNLGANLLQTGDVAGATVLFERALTLEPRNPRFHFYLVLGRSGALDDAALLQMERLAGEAETLPSAGRIDLHFALAAVYERRGRDDEAFGHLVAGNALKRTAIRYDEAAALRAAEVLEATFTEAFVHKLRGCGNPSARPIFVFGMPRSGTTLVEQLLAAQPAVAAAGELTVLDRMAREPAQAIAAEMTTAELRSRIRAIGDGYLRATDSVAGNVAHVTDKAPENFWYAPLIHLALPNARMVHVRRDRLDTCWSCFSQLFVNQALPYTYDLGELGRYYRAYERAMAAWRTLLPADRFIEIDYERLVEDFEAQARRLVAFCGLPWDTATLAFHEVRHRVQIASIVQVRQPLYRSAVGRSRRFAAHLGPLIAALTDPAPVVSR